MFTSNVQNRKIIQDWRGLRVTVMGLGLFGGGLAVSRWLLDNGAKVTITDLKTETELTSSVSALRGEPVRWRLGGHDLEDFQNADVVVVNPAVPKNSHFIRSAIQEGCQITSEMNLFFERCPSKILGVTGTNGKTTTSTLIYKILKFDGGRAWFGGNVGISLLDSLKAMEKTDWVVLELSSFQLEDLGELHLGPDIAVVTNLTPNHLDRHKDMESYIAAKKNMVHYLRPQGIAVLNRQDELVWKWADCLFEKQKKVWGFSLNTESAMSGTYLQDGFMMARSQEEELVLMSMSNFQLPGIHNTSNALAAAAAGLAAGASVRAIDAALSQFKGLPHRLELVCNQNGIRFYNDSKATTPEAAIVALRSFPEKVILLAGGYDKKLPLDALGYEIAKHAKTVLLMGDSASALRQIILKYLSDENSTKIFLAESLTEATELACQKASAGDVVLLSPGFASYGMFNNYVERGCLFQDAIERILNTK